MTRTSTSSGTAIWEILQDKVLRSRLDSFSGCLVLPGDGLKYSLLVFSCCLSLVFVAAFSQAWNLKEGHIRTRVALQALVTILVPTCSLWPSRYIGLASALRLHINIPLEVIIKDTIDGVIEFRNPSNDLADLIGPGKTVNRHVICINIGWKWWVKYFNWWMLAKEAPTGQSKSGYPFLRSPGYMQELSGWLHHNIPTANSSRLYLSPSPSTLTSSTLDPLLCLDCLPHGTIPSFNAGCKVTLEFSAFSPSLRILGTAQIISAIPFMMSERPRRWPRPLVSVLKQLSASFGPNMVIESLSNVSLDYEHALCHVYKPSSGEQKIRKMWVKTLGIKAWRREMFLVALEAALVRRGWIERWAIQVAVK